MKDFWQELISPLELFTAVQEEDSSITSWWDFFLARKGVETDDAYPRVSLAWSDTFFGYGNDSGHLSYDEQYSKALEKFNEFVAQVSWQIGKEPDKDWQPVFPTQNEEQFWDNYFDFIEEHEFAHEFDGELKVWLGDEKVLFLSMNKEDKELPYNIDLGIVDKDLYQKLLKKYFSLSE